MLFKCPCGFVNYVDALPANQRLTCEGCRKTWVVSKKGRKRRRRVHIVYLALAGVCVLVPATWPLSPMLLGAVVLRMVLLERRHNRWIRIGLTVLTPIILGLIGGVVFGTGVDIARLLAARGNGAALGHFADDCLTLSVSLQEWTSAGLALFGVYVVAACVDPFIPKSKYGNQLEKGQKIALAALAVVAALGLLVFLGQGSLGALAVKAEANLNNRYLDARMRNERAKRAIALLISVNSELQQGIRPEDKDAFARELATQASAADAVNVAERYLLEQGLESGPKSASQPAGDQDEESELLWQAGNRNRLASERKSAADEEATEAHQDQELGRWTATVAQTASSAIGLSPSEHAKAIDAYFMGMIEFVVDRFPAQQVELRKSDIAAAICSPFAAHELFVRETVSKLYRQAVAAETLETWQPNSKSYSVSLETKTITIRNTSGQALQFWAVGPNVREASIPPGAKQDIALDKGTYQAVLSVAGATPTVLDLGYGAGHLSGEYTSQKTWIPDADSESGS